MTYQASYSLQKPNLGLFPAYIPFGHLTASIIPQVYEPGKGLDFHFDKDETLMKEQSEMRHPYLSSVLYLTGDKQKPRLGSLLSRHEICSDELMASCALASSTLMVFLDNHAKSYGDCYSGGEWQGKSPTASHHSLSVSELLVCTDIRKSLAIQMMAFSRKG